MYVTKRDGCIFDALSLPRTVSPKPDMEGQSWPVSMALKVHRSLETERIVGGAEMSSIVPTNE
jgi:hypothetical protein